MKNKQLHEFFRAMTPVEPQMPLASSQFRAALLSKGVQKQSLFSRLKGTFLNTGSRLMGQNKKLVGFGSLAVLAIFVLSFAAYTYKYSPKAVAQALVDESLVSLKAAPSDKIDQLRIKFGGSPADALKEAKAAKDLRVITKAEYEKESSNAVGIFGTTLSDDPNAPSSGMVSLSGKSANGGSFGVAAVGVGNGGQPPEGVSTMHVESGTAISTEAGPTFSTHVDSSNIVQGTVTSGQAVAISGTTKAGQAFQVNTDGKDLPPPNPVDFKIVEPSKYLRYTDHNGRVVVLSLDDKGLPMSKTIFMTQADMDEATAGMPKPGLKSAN